MTPRPTAVVTGAGRGIGAATALRLASGGYAVVAVARTRDELEGVAAQRPGIVPVVADVAEESGIDGAVAAAAGLGPLRAWVNNAAVLDPGSIESMEVASWDRTIAVNLRGAFLGCRAAMRCMRESGGGVIVNIGSLSGVPHVEKFAGLGAYNASKAGVSALSEMVALEGREHGIRCVTLSPGAVDTALLRRAAPHLQPGTTPDEVAAIIEFLLSDAAAPLSGSTIPMFTNR